MTKRTIIFTILAITLISLGVFLLILQNFDPESTGFAIKLAFFASLFVVMTGFLVFILDYLYSKFTNRFEFSIISTSFRQAILLGFFITGLLIFKALKVLTSLEAVLLFVAVLIVEIYFWSLNTTKKPR